MPFAYTSLHATSQSIPRTSKTHLYLQHMSTDVVRDRHQDISLKCHGLDDVEAELFHKTDKYVQKSSVSPRHVIAH